MSEVFVPVVFRISLGSYEKGMQYRIKPEAAKVLWNFGVVDVIDEMDRVSGEVDKVLHQEMEFEPLTDLPKDLYERVEFWIWYAENYVRVFNADVNAISAKLTKLAVLKKKVRHLRAVRLKKIVTAARLRPHSEEILTRLTPDEAEVYEYLSDVAERWFE